MIVGRSFCNTNIIKDLDEIRRIFDKGIAEIRQLESEAQHAIDYFKLNHKAVVEAVSEIVREKQSV